MNRLVEVTLTIDERQRAILETALSMFEQCWSEHLQTSASIDSAREFEVKLYQDAGMLRRSIGYQFTLGNK